MTEELERREEGPSEQPAAVGEGQWLYERRPELEPKEFAEGFTLKTVLGALFLSVIMLPGSIYLGLMMGQSMGPAGQWT